MPTQSLVNSIKTILHGEPKNDKDLNIQEECTSHYQKLHYLHKVTAERIVKLEDVINHIGLHILQHSS